jgi:integrase
MELGVESRLLDDDPLVRFESDSPLVNLIGLGENRVLDNKKSVDPLGLKWTVVARPDKQAQIRFRAGGKQVSISTGFKNPKALSAVQQAGLIRKWLKSNPVEKRGKTTFEAEVTRFIRFQYEGKASHTVKEAEAHLKRFQTILGVSAVEQVTKKLCEAKKTQLQGAYSPKTWKNFLTGIRKFIRWQIGEGVLLSDPLMNFKNPSRKTFGRRLTTWDLERYKKTLKALKPLDREILTILYETGIDSADFFALRPSHIIEARRPDKTKFWKLYKLRAKAKSSDEMIDQPLSSEALKVILPRLSEWFSLPSYSTSNSFVASFLRRVKKAQVKAGFEPMDIKSLRHTFATRHAKRFLDGAGGPPMEVLRQWMGHAPSSRVLETVYVHTRSNGLYMT